MEEDNVITLIYKPHNVYDKNLYIELEELAYQIESLNGVENIASIFTSAILMKMLGGICMMTQVNGLKSMWIKN